MRSLCKIYGLILSLLLCLIICPSSLPAEELTDAEKLQVVYEMYEEYKESFPEVEDVTPKQAMELMQSEEVIFVDTRKSKEQKVSMLPNAVTEKDFEKNPEQYRDQVLIGYCTISYRSGKLAKKLQEKGITMLNLRGGMLAWVHEGGKVYDANGETKRLHVYKKKWNYVPEGYEAVWSFFLF
ncbi:MAG: rhodanese-like domain-containing protein [Deltaproteobacteria bacterium]|nr:rhodanese-like domain-containing protein [Deltaproteobacteria bacterium]